MEEREGGGRENRRRLREKNWERDEDYNWEKVVGKGEKEWKGWD